MDQFFQEERIQLITFQGKTISIYTLKNIAQP